MRVPARPGTKSLRGRPGSDTVGGMTFANRMVMGILRSPVHGIMSAKVAILRYRGRRSGQEFELPVQYLPTVDGVVVLVAKPGAKRWWRNFHDGHPLELLIAGRWRRGVGSVLLGSENPADMQSILHAYTEWFPSAKRMLGPDPLPGSVAVSVRFDDDAPSVVG